jgi:diamine N-acetyltransferase
MSLKIEPVYATQIELLQQIGEKTYREHFSEIWTEVGINNYLQAQFDMEKLVNSFTEDGTKYFLSYWNLEPVGLIKLNFNKSLPNSSNDTGLELEKIYLLKEFSGRGIGEKMLNFVINQAIQNLERFVWLDVLKNNDRAKRFYERNGFIVVDEIEFYTDKLMIDMWVMKKQLSNGNR